MAETIFWVIWITFLVTAKAGPILNDDFEELPGRQFFLTLPEEERPDYLNFELGRAYLKRIPECHGIRQIEDDLLLPFPDALDIPMDLLKKFENLDVPTNFTENLFDLVQTEFNLDDRNIRTLIVKRNVCFENGNCIDLDDIGTLCCPF